ncbi:hypothetical protein GDN83_18080 [Gordonia jinghuaiqii]|uniref:Uncharacterized protein n=1 Tax=Gordonia jinghuaiqii TaxID=2758710 RepID=A0A7D7R945_9ACTN|nr:hypothetical protein [Gordonia jinghuaiqii]MCR5979623.1 hypothetical protein [Gordonia jinghuaiqii]QMT00590.1 hypothetical protein H1R19_17055 [Gordonia jinghuaiqii]
MTIRFRNVSAGLACGAALAIGAAMAPAASAAPNDVTATPSVSGNTITLTVQNNAAKRIGCEVVGVPAGGSPSNVAFGYQTPEQLGALISPGSSKALPMRLSEGTPPTPTGSTTLPDGTYDIYWGCTTITLPPGTGAAEQFWGTNPPLTEMTPTDAEPIRVTLPAAGQPAPGEGAPGVPADPAKPEIPGLPGVQVPDEVCAMSACYPLP